MDQQIGYSGYTLEQLSAYYDSGRQPRIAAIESDAEARAMLDSMDRIARITKEPEANSGSGFEPAWVERVLDVVRDEVRAGRDLPMRRVDANTETSVTEGALRELARSVGDSVDDVLVGSVTVRGVDSALDVRVTIGVRYGAHVLRRADEARTAIIEAVQPHAPAPLRTVDVIVDDVFATQEDADV